MLLISARAPSNIALVKYMGKRDPASNLPENPSLSMTLNDLCSFAEVRESSSTAWVPELPKAAAGIAAAKVPILSSQGAERILRQLERVRKASPEILPRYGLRARFGAPSLELRTANTFPSGSGIASSASSFAATTLAAAAFSCEQPQNFAKLWGESAEFRREWSRVARQGSGSSCRSFDGPWVLWENEEACRVESALPRMAHFVILVSSEEKAVSSSEAHLRVKYSPLWQGRVERARQRTTELQTLIGRGDLAGISRLAWRESWEMHSLFHTSSDPFTYWQPGSLSALGWVRPFLSEPIPPIVTMDAGPNVHIIVPETLRETWRNRLRERFGTKGILEDGEGRGAQVTVT